MDKSYQDNLLGNQYSNQDFGNTNDDEEIIQINNDDIDELIDESEEIDNKSKNDNDKGLNYEQKSTNANIHNNTNSKNRLRRKGRNRRSWNTNNAFKQQFTNKNRILPFVQNTFTPNTNAWSTPPISTAPVNNLQNLLLENNLHNLNPINKLKNVLQSANNQLRNVSTDSSNLGDSIFREANLINKDLLQNNDNYVNSFENQYKTNPLLLVVVDRGFPLIHLTPFHLYKFREAVQKELDESQDTPPKFEESAIRRGAIILLAVDEYARNWLISKIHTLCPWDGASLRIGGVELFKPLIKAKFWVPGPSEDPILVLNRIKRYNPTLQTESWLINNVHEQPIDDDDGRMFFISLPETSISCLKELDYRPYYDLGRLNIIP